MSPLTAAEKEKEIETFTLSYEIKIDNRENTIDNSIRLFSYLNKRTDRSKRIENIESAESIIAEDTLPVKFKEGQHLIINKTLLTISLYEDGKMIKKYPVSIGTKYNPTPSGIRHIQNRVVNPYWGGMFGKYRPVKGGAPNNPLGKRWMGLRNGYGIHGTIEEWSIGTVRTHGCIRLFNKDVAELFELVKVGSPVYIGDEEYLKILGIEQREGTVKYTEKVN